MLPNEDLEKIKKEIDTCKNPLFFFDDDPDGLCSFLILYRYIKEGHGIVVKAKPSLNIQFLRKVEEYDPDKIFILDIPVVDQEFIDAVKRPVIWIDHHSPIEREKVMYFNPRKSNKDTCITRICYEIAKQDIWIAALGSIADWQMPGFFEEFRKSCSLVGSESSIGGIYFKTKLGKLIKIFSFIMKGKTNDANKCFKILTRIESPEEILEQTTSRGKLIYKRFESISQEYELLLKSASKKATEDPFLIFIYDEAKTSFTGDLSNELKYLFPGKVIIVGREKDGEVRMSIRCDAMRLDKALEKALIGIRGYGGGHEYACGANVKKEDFDRFIEALREQFN